MSDSEQFKEQLPSKGNFYSSLTGRKVTDKEHRHALYVWNNFEMETMKDYYDLYQKYDVFLLADMLEQLEIMAKKTVDYVQVII